jgi:hypothetical protein
LSALSLTLSPLAGLIFSSGCVIRTSSIIMCLCFDQKYNSELNESLAIMR